MGSRRGFDDFVKRTYIANMGVYGDMLMIKIIGKSVAETSMKDARFLQGQGVLDAMKNEFEFGKEFSITFDDGSKLTIAPAKDSLGDKLVGCYYDTNEIK